MSLSEISIRRPVFAWMLLCAIIIFGYISFERLGISNLPDVDFPVVGVGLSLPGAAPEVIESQVIDPIEDAIMEIDGIRTVNSSAGQSSGSISIEFELNQNIDVAMQQVQNKINQVQNLLPNNLFPPTLRKVNPEDQPILWVAVTSDDPNLKPMDMMIFARNYMLDKFATVPGVGNVVFGGYVDPALRVWADINKLEKYDITSGDILQAIKQEHIEVPAGQIENSKNEYFVRVLGEAKSPEEFSKIPISARQNLGPNFRPLTIGQVATVEEGITDVRKKCRLNGKPAVGLGIIKQHGSNAVEVADNVRQRLKEIEPSIPKPYRATIRSDSTVFIKQSVKQMLFTLLMAAILTSVVCYLFLGSFSSTLNVLMAIPTSIIGTFIAFYAFGFTLNTFTLLGLSLAIGIVVDDAIMMLENIVRHRELGENRFQAALKGSKEITFAAVAATVAVVAIFLPVVFMKGVIGKYFLQYGLTVTVAVSLSLLEALTLTPMRCSRYLNYNAESKGLAGRVDKMFGWLAGQYQKSLDWTLNHRWKTLSITLLACALSLLVARSLPSEMMPAQDQSKILMRFKLPVGSSIQMTDGKIREVEEYLLKQPETDGVFSIVGGFGGDAVNQGIAFVTLVDPGARKLNQAEVIKKFRGDLRKLVHGVEIIIQDLSMRGFAASRGFPVEFTIQGPNWDTMTRVTDQIIEKLKASDFVTDVNTDIQNGMPQVEIIPDRQKLAERGVSLSSVTSVVNALMGGAILLGTSEYPKDQHRYQIELRLVGSQRDNVLDLRRVRVRNNRGQTVPLSEVATIQQKPSLMQISRTDRSRAITVYANQAGKYSQKEAIQKSEEVARSLLPPGYSLKASGTSKSFQESIQSLIVAMLLGILVSYMVLASQFNSFVHPIAVLMALPFSFSGAFIALKIGSQSINIFSLIGFILLMGIVKKNSILLVDFTNHVRKEGLGVRAALLKACPIRLRPILMTSAATVAGALPEALSLGPGSETITPMAIALIGGVIVSTVLTLFVVPCVYSLLARFEKEDSLEVEVPLTAEAVGAN